jgi:dipeptidyl aminopeptidase/acylaminoacyl peptidase
MPGSIESMFVNGVPCFTGTGGGILETPDAAAKANPINYITKNSAPLLLMHGTADNVVSPAQTDLLFQALKNNGVEAERYIVPNANHSDDYWQQEEVFNLILDFLKKHI